MNPLRIFFILILTATGLSACQRPTGDFGRAKPSIVHDQLLPKLGYSASRLRNDPISSYDYTDNEKRLRDISWRLVLPPHAKDWIGASYTEWQRTQLGHRLDLYQPPERYSFFLMRTNFRSSQTRYHKINDDAAKDIASIAPFFLIANRVKQTDRQRKINAQNLPDIHVNEVQKSYGRIGENQRYIAWVRRALYFRLYAYRYALDRLMLAAPDPDLYQTVKERLYLFEAEIKHFDSYFDSIYPDPAFAPNNNINLMAPLYKK